MGAFGDGDATDMGAVQPNVVDRMNTMFPDLDKVQAASGYNSNLIVGSTSSAGSNVGGLDPSQAGGGGAGQQYQGGNGSEVGLMSVMAFMPAITGLLGVWGNVEDIKAKKDVLISNIRAKGKKLMWSQEIKLQQIKDIATIFSDKLSASGFESLKAEARLKAASAETGATADRGSNATAIAQANVNRLHRDAMIFRTADIKKYNSLQAMVSDRMNFEFELESMTSGQSSGASMFLSSLNSTTSSIMSGLNFMNDAQKEEFFGAAEGATNA